jgi:hypothetical protein
MRRLKGRHDPGCSGREGKDGQHHDDRQDRRRQGPVRAFTSKQHWPAMADSDLTFTIAALGINVPLTKAPTGGVWTTVFTYKVDKAGSYCWSCMTPAAAGPTG